ncbi:MAG: hypothetical protein JRI68_12155, partial [Deltaproteobacteria bacterium]|nr:hypothetical protein [Deltaproteobacteria bacterium]
MRLPQTLSAALTLVLLCCAGCSEDGSPDTSTNTSTSTSGGGTGGTTSTGGSGGGGLGGTGGTAPAGGLAISDDGHWLEFRGRSVLLAGDSITQGWMELGTHFDQITYLDALASRDIPVVMLWTFIGVVDQQNDPRIGYDA